MVPKSVRQPVRALCASRFAAGLKRMALDFCPSFERVTLNLRSRRAVWVAFCDRTNEAMTHCRLELLNVKIELLVRFLNRGKSLLYVGAPRFFLCHMHSSLFP